MSSGTTEFLDYVGPVPQDTSVTRSGIKWNNTTPVGAIDKSPVQFTIPACIFQNATRAFYSYIVGQFNYQASQPFSILNYKDLAITNSLLTTFCGLCIRYRIGAQVFRYNLIPKSLLFPSLVPNPPQSQYTGQKIGANFVIELWSPVFGDGAACGLINPITYNTSILALPSPYPTSFVGIPNTPSYITPSSLFTDLFLPLPINNPAQFNSLGPWNSN